ncbi:MAG: exosortase/archaeosortase family protein [Methylacidiphilales bacterium]|nr:exosortase/archaeosortase family protein [Candidatus Methylacidiphilales bacterium]
MTVTPKIISKPGETLTVRRTDVPWMNWVLLIGAGILAFHPVSITWNSNANYSYGWWIPLICLFLFFERWPTRPPREPSGLRTHLVPLVVLWGLIFFAFRLAAEADPDWRPGLWVLAGLYVAALLGWLWLYGGKGWLRHFAFPVCFLLLSLPWLFAIELPLVEGLMHWNASLASSSLRLLAIPAIAEGNIIQLANGQLGVEEACSGILSLQSSIMLGCLLGEIYRLGALRRVVLVLLTIVLALVGNYGRTLFLALLAVFHGNDAVMAWHDTAGYSILLLTGAGAWLACLCLRDGFAPWTMATAPASTERDFPEPWRPAQFLAVSIFAAAALSEAGTQVWFGLREAKIPHHPEWTAQMPQTGNFKPEALSKTAREALLCDAYKAGSWRDDKAWNWTAFWFLYNPKTSNKSVLGWHNPDNCLPSVGLKKDEDYPNFTANLNGLDFYVQPKRFSTPDRTIYLFWVIYPLSGSLPPVIDNQSNAPFDSKFRTHLADVWEGNRGVGVETIEVAVTGPPNYDAAKAAYLECLKGLAVPNTPGSSP